MEIKFDCRYLVGEKPCKFKRECKNCPSYEPIKKKILIVNLGAMGDVLRTTTVLEALKKKYNGAYITWLVDSAARPLLESNKYIDKIYNFGPESNTILMVQHFDILICLEKEERAVSLAMMLRAEKKFGFGMNEKGNINILNKEAEYAYMLGISDELKFYKNSKTYPEIIFEIIGLEYHKDEYYLETTCAEDKFSLELFKKINLFDSNIVIGISPGAGQVFAKKAWGEYKYIKLINKLALIEGVKIILLGGISEAALNQKIKDNVNVAIYDGGCHNSLRQFAAIIKRCNMIICGDTLPMHLAISQKRHVLAIFGPTCTQEIELYGRGRIINTTVGCAPCYKNRCHIEEDCMKAISVDEVYNSAIDMLNEVKR